MMTELETLAKMFGAPGVFLALGLAALRFFGPYIRDTYLPGRLAAQEKSASAMQQVADVVSRMDVRMTGVEHDLVVVQSTGAAIRSDLSIILDRIDVDRSRPPTILLPGATST